MISSRLLQLLHEWVPRQRWYGSKGRAPALSEVAQWDLPSPADGVGVHIHLLADTAGDRPVLFQIPVTSRATSLPDGEAALIGTDGDTLYYDGPHDDAFVHALLTLVLGNADPSINGALRGTALSTAGDGGFGGSRVLSGEQSNTSIIVEAVPAGGVPVICKLFRVLHPGENPDVAVQSALAALGSQRVPRPLGYLTGEWTDPGSARPVRGHVAFAQEFLAGAEDAWRVALRAAAAGEDFTRPARSLGAATASVHADLARAFPTVSPTAESIAAMVEGMRERYRAALEDVPSLGDYAAAVEATLTAAGSQQWPLLQRIHGDCHLGQVLQAPGRGWMLIDFEGEPLRPMDERGAPDAALRDVAGMLRSLSYVAGSV
ncbi:MAG TPA: 1,4-alpha-glucan branching enzyme, partial [Terrimesophilobacter sp.]|nr:1,4-alpha-glucan branching enzyme [Terrimesophilobacter sp.]